MHFPYVENCVIKIVIYIICLGLHYHKAKNEMEIVFLLH